MSLFDELDQSIDSSEYIEGMVENVETGDITPIEIH